jgi:hypothetical protein
MQRTAWALTNDATPVPPLVLAVVEQRVRTDAQIALANLDSSALAGGLLTSRAPR